MTGGFFFSTGKNTSNDILQKTIEGQLETVKYMIDNNLVNDFTARDENGDTVLHLLARKYSENPIASAIVNLLLNAGERHIFLNIQNKEGDTPLHIAVKEGNMILAEKLLEAGANKKIKNDIGQHIESENEENIKVDKTKKNLQVFDISSKVQHAHSTQSLSPLPLNLDFTKKEIALKDVLDVDMSDSLSRLSLNKGATDSLSRLSMNEGVTDSLSRLPMNESATESLSRLPMSNSATESLSRSESATESLSRSESATESLSRSESTTESLSRSDSATDSTTSDKEESIINIQSVSTSEELADSLIRIFGNKMSGGNKVRLGNRKLNGGEYESKLARLVKNQGAEIHERVIKKIIEILKVDESKAKLYKAYLYNTIKETKQELSNLDKAFEMEKLATQKFLENIKKNDLDKLQKKIDKFRTERVIKKDKLIKKDKVIKKDKIIKKDKLIDSETSTNSEEGLNLSSTSDSSDYENNKTSSASVPINNSLSSTSDYENNKTSSASIPINNSLSSTSDYENNKTSSVSIQLDNSLSSTSDSSDYENNKTSSASVPINISLSPTSEEDFVNTSEF
jgi:epidermal growth factor receptor substrate 15